MASSRPGAGAARISRADALACRPVKNSEVSESRLESGEVVLTVALTVRPWFAGLARRLGVRQGGPQHRRVQLDALGTAVWDLIDGRRTVGRVVARFAEKFQLHPREAEVAVTQFVRDLGKRGLIGLDFDPP